MNKPRLGSWEPDGDGGLVAYVLDGATGTLRTRGAVVADMRDHIEPHAFEGAVLCDGGRVWEGQYAADEFEQAQRDVIEAAAEWYEVRGSTAAPVVASGECSNLALRGGA